MDKREIVSKMEFHRAAQFHISAPSQNGVNEVGHKYIDFLKQVVLLLRGSHPIPYIFFPCHIEPGGEASLVRCRVRSVPGDREAHAKTLWVWQGLPLWLHDWKVVKKACALARGITSESETKISFGHHGLWLE